MGRALAPPRPVDPRLFEVQEHELANGLKVRLLADRHVPAVSLYTFFRVGSRNERPGITGIAHLFEHMMFNGAARYGPKEFDRLLESNGGHSNAYTSHDVTAYYEDFAAEALDLVLDLESDRMRSLALAAPTLESERKVVKEERRFSVENEPLGVLDEELYALCYSAHPYRWPVIGWMDDIEAIRREDCLEFFRTYYAPNNATLWAVGDLDPARALAAIEARYGDIPRGPPVPLPVSTEPRQRGERRSRVRFPAHSEALAVGYKAPAGASPDAVVLDVIQYALCAGEGARLMRKLVYEQLLAANVMVDYAWKVDRGLVQVLVELNPKVHAERALQVIDRELGRVARRGFTDLELGRAKGQLRAQVLRELSTNNGRAHTLGTYEQLLGSWRAALQIPERYAAVTNAEVQRVAQEVFRESARSVVVLEPACSEAEEAAHG
ncbi:MAG: insulinase family protein [Deltaproteobacteria bacterium]|nr:insulinase family protein [Deltaproteobacteria bacterium]